MKETLSLSYRATAELDADRPAQRQRVAKVALNLGSQLPNDERSILVTREEHIWDAAFNAGILLPALCHQGRCLTCAGRLEGPGNLDQSDSVDYYPQIGRAHV